MTLYEAKKGTWYLIDNINKPNESDYSRFYKLGLVPGIRVALERRAPIFRDPILIQLEDSQIVLSKSEALSVEIREI